MSKDTSGGGEKQSRGSRRDGGHPPRVDRDDSGEPERAVRPRRERYLVAVQPAPYSLHTGALAAFDAGAVLARIEADPDCAVRRIIRAPGEAGTQVFPDVAVVEMDPDRAAALASTVMVTVEPDLPLRYADPHPAAGLTYIDPGIATSGEDATVTFTVRGSDGKALDGAEVYVTGPACPVRGVTAADGTVRLSLPAAALHTVGGVYVKPRHDHWAIWLGRPELAAGATHEVVCPRLSDTFDGFPDREVDAWGRRAMRFDALPPTFRGHGMKIAIIDSGAALEHPDLAGRVRAGCDVVGQPSGGENPDGWRIDPIGRGSHSAGTVAASDNGAGIVGIVPEAELHACRVYPDGYVSDLLAALDYCIANQIDVVTLGLGVPQGSGLLARKIEQARQAGVACVAAAGDTGGPVHFPASLPGVLCVAAIGRTGEFPPGSYHATQVTGAPTAEGYFSPKFTAYGPEVDVCAPGVAIVSCVPPGNHAAYDGTSFAAPYVSALAALLLAHHPEFRDRFAARTAARVERLFDLIRSSCQPLPLGDPGRTGAGLPDAVRALGLVPPMPPMPPADPALAGLWQVMMHAGLVAAPMPVAVPAGAGGEAAPGFGSTGLAAGFGPALTTAAGTDVLAPLRAALRAAGLLAPATRPDAG